MPRKTSTYADPKEVGTHWYANPSFVAIATALNLGIAIAAIAIPIFREHNKEDFNITVDSKIDNKLDPIHRDINSLDQKLTKVQATLDTLQPFVQELVRHRIDAASVLPQREFNQKLPSISNTVSAAIASKTVVDPAAIKEVNAKLSVTLDANNVVSTGWSTAAQLISYQSLALSKFSERPSKICLKIPAGYTPHPLVGASDFNDVAFSDCELRIDDPSAFWASPYGKIFLTELAQNSHAKLRLLLTRVLVSYSGGELIPADQIFGNACTFLQLSSHKQPTGPWPTTIAGIAES